MTTNWIWILGSLLCLLAPLASAQSKPSLRSTSREEQAENRCVHNVSARLKSIEEVYYPKLAKRGPAGAKAWFARKDLEVARWYLHGEEGFKAATGGCDPAVRGTERFKELEARWAKAEALVLELEQAKGVVFVEVREPNDIIYNDAKTGQPVARASSY